MSNQPRRQLLQIFRAAPALVALTVSLGNADLQAAPRSPNPPWPEKTFYLENFDEPYQLADPSTADPTLFSPSWSGYCLDRTASPPLTPWTIPATIALDLNRGAIRFGYAPAFDSGTGPGTPATLLTLVSTNDTTTLTWFSLVVSADGTTIQLQCPNADGSTSPCLTAPASFKAGVWTLITLGYSATNAALWLNQTQVAAGSAPPSVPSPVMPLTALVVGSDIAGQATAAGQIDLLTTFSGSTAFPANSPYGIRPGWSINFYYVSQSHKAALGLVPDATTSTRMGTRMATVSFPPPPPTNPPAISPAPHRPASTNGLVLVPPDSIPRFGTFWSLMRTNYPPLLYDKFTNCPVWSVGPDSTVFLVDDSSVPSWQLYPTNAVVYDSPAPMGVTNDPASFYLSIGPVTNGIAPVTLHNTIPATSYTLMSRQSLLPGVPWLVEQDLIGTSNQDWTLAQVPVFGRSKLFLQAHTGQDGGPRVLFLETAGMDSDWVNLNVYSTGAGQTYDIETTPTLTNPEWTSQGTFLGLTNWTPVALQKCGPSLFMRARCWATSGDSDIPIWWLDQYFGGTNVDPYAFCPSGDQWTIEQAWQNGWDPLLWYPPPAPVAWAYIAASGTSRVMQWEAEAGAAGYELIRDLIYPNNGNLSGPVSTQFVGSVTLALTDNSIRPPSQDPDINPDGYTEQYYLFSTYPQGLSLPALITDSTTLQVSLIHGAGNSMQLALFSAPKGTTAIRISMTTNNVCGWGIAVNQTFDIPTASFTNDLYTFSDAQDPFYTALTITAQAITPNGFAGLPRVIESNCERTIRYPVLDASQVMKDNLIFTFQAQPPVVAGAWYLSQPEGLGLPPLAVLDGFGQLHPQPRYALASYRTSWNRDAAFPFWSDVARPLHPWEINAALKGSEYQPTPLSCFVVSNYAGDWPYGVGNSCCILSMAEVWTEGPYGFDSAGFALSGASTGCPSALADPNGRILANWDGVWAVPAITDDGTTSRVASTYPNAFGLPFQGLEMILRPWGAPEAYPFFFGPGDSWQDDDYGQGWFGGEQFEAPSIAPDIYQFTTGGNLDSLSPYYLDTNGTPVPEPLLITSVGDPRFTLSAWRRYHLLNGNPGTYGYVEQYFDSAYVMGTNGLPTTNATGILSPYGYFFATEPGAITVLTTTNIENGGHGIGVVQAISVSTDANHDGTMDPTFGGPDYTSPTHPFRFWVNDNHDSGDDGGTGVPGLTNGVSDATRFTQIRLPGNAGYQQVYQVHGTRDLIDFFPVCINVASLFQTSPYGGFISPLDSNYEFKLRQADGALRFAYTSLTPANFMAYLTNVTVAESLASAQLTTITAAGVDLTNTFLEGIDEGNQNVIIVEAASPTAQPLVLELWQYGTNLLAQTSLYLNITGVEQMFRHKNLMLGQTAAGPRAPVDRLSDQDVPNEPDTNDKNFVFVHGYNNNPTDARGTFADVFKRLYWSGSHAKFYGVTWFGYDTQIAGMVTINFHTNALHAIETSTSLAGFISTLTNGPSTVAGHSLGNMVVLSALSDHGAPISNYFMLDAAVAMEAIDASQQTPYMVDSRWAPYTNRLYSTEWHNLFTNDFRQTLTWRGRFPNFGNAQVCNFYSSGEEVLREWNVDPPTGILSAFAQAVEDAVVSQSPTKSFVWVWQEKAKGIAASDNLLGSTHGGWKFNANYTGLTAAQAAALPDYVLRTNAFFDFSSPTFTSDLTLLDTNWGNYYASVNGDRILSDAIPAVSWAIGSHSVPRLAPPQSPDERNFDMQALYENGWPADRPVQHVGATALGEWWHSDFRQVAYTFTYELFNKLVATGDLK